MRAEQRREDTKRYRSERPKNKIKTARQELLALMLDEECQLRRSRMVLACGRFPKETPVLLIRAGLKKVFKIEHHEVTMFHWSPEQERWLFWINDRRLEDLVKGKKFSIGTYDTILEAGRTLQEMTRSDFRKQAEDSCPPLVEALKVLDEVLAGKTERIGEILGDLAGYKK